MDIWCLCLQPNTTRWHSHTHYWRTVKKHYDVIARTLPAGDLPSMDSINELLDLFAPLDILTSVVSVWLVLDLNLHTLFRQATPNQIFLTPFLL